MIELGMVSIVNNGARVPEHGMLPGAVANDKSRLFRPGFHAAATPLPDDSDINLNESDPHRATKKRERFSGSKQEFAAAADFNAVDQGRSYTVEKHRIRWQHSFL